MILRPRAQLRRGSHMRELRGRFPWYRVPQSRAELAATIGLSASPTDGVSHLWVVAPPADGGLSSAVIPESDFDPVALLSPRPGANMPRYSPDNYGRSVEIGARFIDGEQRSFILPAVGTFPITVDQGFILWCYFPNSAAPVASRDPLSKGTGTPSVTCRILSTGRAQIRHVNSAGAIVTATLGAGSEVMRRLVPIWYASTVSTPRISVASIDRSGIAVAAGAVVVAALGDSAQPWNLGSAPAGSGPDVIILAMARIVGPAAVQADDGLAMLRRLWPWRTQDAA